MSQNALMKIRTKCCGNTVVTFLVAGNTVVTLLESFKRHLTVSTPFQGERDREGQSKQINQYVQRESLV